MCTLTSADVKAVLDRMNYVLDKSLHAGRIVQLGEIGNFRMAVGGSGVAKTDDFKASQIRKPVSFLLRAKSYNSRGAIVSLSSFNMSK